MIILLSQLFSIDYAEFNHHMRCSNCLNGKIIPLPPLPPPYPEITDNTFQFAFNGEDLQNMFVII